MARRKRNEGTVYKRKDGRYMIRTRGADGKPHWLYTRDEKQIEPLKTKALYDAARGLRQADGRKTFEQFATSWLETNKAYKKASTWKVYEVYLRLYLLPAFGAMKLAKLDYQEIERFQTRMVKQVGPRTLQSLRSLLHQMFNDAVRQNLIPRNPCELVKRLPRQGKREMLTLSEEEATRFLAAAHTYPLTTRLAALYVLDLTTGLRQGEVLGLRWQDIDWKKKKLHVRQQAALVPDVFTGAYERKLVPVLKTDHAYRTISPLSHTAIEALKKHKERQDQEHIQRKSAWHEYDLVFPDELGDILQARTLYYQFKQLVRHARLSDDPQRRATLSARLRFHDLRHTFATLALERGVDPKTVSEILGHSDVAFTLRVYGHVTPRMQQRAADEMDAIFSASVCDGKVVR